MARDLLSKHLRPHALITLIAMMTSGCLGHFYEIPRTELERLARTPPQERGQSVYAVQQFSTAEEPTPAPPWEPVTGEPPPGYYLGLHGHWMPSFYVDYGEPYYEPPPHRSPTVHDASPVGVPSSGTVTSGALPRVLPSRSSRPPTGCWWWWSSSGSR